MEKTQPDIRVFSSLVAMLAVALFGIAIPTQGSEDTDVSENIVISKSKPAIAIKVTNEIPFLGRHAIRIRNIAAGERLVFADLDGNSVKRMVILQFEGFLPTVSEAAYHYNFKGRPVVAGYPFRSNPYSFDLHVTREENPGSESSDTAAFLESLGIVPPKTWMMWRSLTAELPERRDELIIFYVENGDSMGVAISDIYDPTTDQSTAFWREFMVGLEQRANASFQLAIPGESKDMEMLQWQRIPNILSAD